MACIPVDMTCYLRNNFLLQKCWLNKVEKYRGEEQCNVLDIIQYCVSNFFFAVVERLFLGFLLHCMPY